MKTLTQGILTCDTLQQGQEAAHLCHQWMIDHVPGYTAQIWDEPKQRLNDRKLSIYIDYRVLDALTPAQLAGLAAPNPADDWQPATE